MKKITLVLTGLLLFVSAGYAKCLVKTGDSIVLIGDSITEQGYRWKNDGFYHILSNAVPQAKWTPLGYSGHQIRSWMGMERRSVTDPKVWTNYKDPGWSLKEVFDGKVDIIVIFLGMNDILCPTLRDSEAEMDEWIAKYREFVANLDARCNPRLFVFATITPLTADETSPKNIVRKKLGARLRAFAKSFPKAVVADYGEAIEEATEETLEIDGAYRLVPDFVHPNRLGHLYIAKELCDALDLEDAEDKIEKRIDAQLDALKAKNRGRINVRVNACRATHVSDREFAYNLDFAVCGDDDDKIKVRPILPAGWTSNKAEIKDDEGTFRIRGLPTALSTPVGVEVTSPRGTRREMINLPAPWRVKDETGKWLFYSASDYYTGGSRSGSIDPYQLYFGWVKNTITASRRVWSEKDREVKAVLSHQTFSATLDITVALDGQEVWKQDLNRRGKNRVEKVLNLKKGWNLVELTVSNVSWQRQFAFELEGVAGDNLADLKYSIE